MAEATTNKDEPGCCPPGSIGKAAVLSDRPLKGTMVEIPAPSSLQGMEPIPCYCTGVPLASASRIVVIFTDVYGIDAGHHKVFADCLAEQMAMNDDNDHNEDKCTVVIPDLFRGKPILRPWIASTCFAKDIIGSALGTPGMVYRIKKDYPPQKVEQEIFQAILPWLQQQAPTATRLSCVGFCFGGWVVGRVLGYYSTKKEQDEHSSAFLSFQCGVGIHPSFQPNLAHGESQTQMAERISKPMLLLPGWNDLDMKIGTKVVDIMTKKRHGNGEEKPEVSIEFPTMIHGWVTRGDPTDPKVAAEQERALQLTIAFLQKNST